MLNDIKYMLNMNEEKKFSRELKIILQMEILQLKDTSEIKTDWSQFWLNTEWGDRRICKLEDSLVELFNMKNTEKKSR